jgi:hypothetical protein
MGEREELRNEREGEGLYNSGRNDEEELKRLEVVPQVFDETSIYLSQPRLT